VPVITNGRTVTDFFLIKDYTFKAARLTFVQEIGRTQCDTSQETTRRIRLGVGSIIADIRR